ncbi:MAG: 4-hydroxy-3-methylbut-2-enyl diphosphate reductase [Pseudopedobacter saltans]|uniref:4-hydroxy-3-methylbut-2-enyl diphosphate reductase n=1 Tax=Pseudopedobacter saltans TaxID=151895 RepID=A0A2W5H2S8_9SPHI|nr:MAG: 4-hydroxy-3-methylbut-2-enyl diphosphate reductase [Pseudopedobacter saltans]
MKKFDVPNFYRSGLISAIKVQRSKDDRMKKDFSPTLLDLGDLKIYLARHFGFCYGVENAIDIAFRTISENVGKRIFMLSEMIHNPQVNSDLEKLGVRFLQDTYGKQLIPFESLNADDIVIIPAFGTTLEVEETLEGIGLHTKQYNTTCPFVEKVWNRSAQIAEKGYSIVVHGKPKHEETRATFSHASHNTPTVVVNDLNDAIELGKYITGEYPSEKFYEQFNGLYSDGFDVSRDLDRIGVVNQTTQLASSTIEISEYLKKIITDHYQLEPNNIQRHFADTRDTLCYATSDNQSAVQGLMEKSEEADFALVVGGYKSSNTSHLAEICEQYLPTYFINEANKILSEKQISHCDWAQKNELVTSGFLPEKRPVTVLITSGASCPDAIVEQVIKRLAQLTETTPQLDALMEQLNLQKVSSK